MPRKNFTERQRAVVYNRMGNPHGVNHCWHCGCKIYFKKRTTSDGKGAWHMDHYPIPYADIEDQMCCGITNQHDLSNVVPSCARCNLSHRWENDGGRWYYCGRSQNCLGSRKLSICIVGECKWCGITCKGLPISIIIIVLILLLIIFILLYYLNVLRFF